jgi:hypothetical protein
MPRATRYAAQGLQATMLKASLWPLVVPQGLEVQDPPAPGDEATTGAGIRSGVDDGTGVDYSAQDDDDAPWQGQPKRDVYTPSSDDTDDDDEPGGRDSGSPPGLCVCVRADRKRKLCFVVDSQGRCYAWHTGFPQLWPTVSRIRVV